MNFHSVMDASLHHPSGIIWLFFHKGPSYPYGEHIAVRIRCFSLWQQLTIWFGCVINFKQFLTMSLIPIIYIPQWASFGQFSPTKKEKCVKYVEYFCNNAYVVGTNMVCCQLKTTNFQLKNLVHLSKYMNYVCFVNAFLSIKANIKLFCWQIGKIEGKNFKLIQKLSSFFKYLHLF